VRKVFLVSTGGTIASRHDKARGHVAAAASGGELMELLHDPLRGIEVDVDEFCNVGSFNIDLELAFQLARRIDRHLSNEDVAGVVVTHGTDTMEESSFLADLVVRSDKPVVFTGAQRSSSVRRSISLNARWT
jgi:L-asparaginase